MNARDRDNNSLKHARIVASIDEISQGKYGSTPSDKLLPGSPVPDKSRQRYWPVLLVVVLLVITVFVLDRIAWHDSWLTDGSIGGHGNRTSSF